MLSVFFRKSLTFFVCLLLVEQSFSLEKMGENGHPANANKVILNIGGSENVFVDVNVEEARTLTQVPAKLIIRKKGIHADCEAFIFSNVDQIEDALKKKRVDEFTLSAPEFIKLRRRIVIDAIAVPQVDGKVGEKFALLTHRETGNS